MKRYDRVEGFLKECAEGHWVAHKDHLEIVRRYVDLVAALHDKIQVLEDQIMDAYVEASFYD